MSQKDKVDVLNKLDVSFSSLVTSVFSCGALHVLGILSRHVLSRQVFSIYEGFTLVHFMKK